MACGLPVVAHEAPQLRWIAGDNEFLLDTENPANVAGQIERARNTEPARLQRRLTKERISHGKRSRPITESLCEIVASSGQAPATNGRSVSVSH